MQTKVDILNGEVVGSFLHDAEILGMILGDGNLALKIRLVDGKLINLTLRGVYRLIANEFREGNIILDLDILTGEDLALEDFRIFYSSKTNNSAIFLLNKVKSEKKIFARINSSYGCELSCICDEISCCEG